jgi:CheY-like chemotaxis protein/predicted regulator of Ras-like GTPase activity (Roadblock/LC7/MglB family)
MKARALAALPPLPDLAPTPARRILVVDDDPGALQLITNFLRTAPVPCEPMGVDSAEAALRILSGEDGLDCLLIDVAPPEMDGLRLLLAARERRPELKIVAMASVPTDDLHRAVLEAGASWLLSKPLDLDDLQASLAADRPGVLSHLEGDLDLLDVCRLAAACQPNGGIRVRRGESEGILAHRGATLVHAEMDGLKGEPAFAGLRAWNGWHFESLPALRAAALPESCDLDLRMAAGGPRREGSRAGGTLRGLTLRHLIEWAMRSRETCSLTVTSRRRTGVLSFARGKIGSAETADREGGRAAAEILGWENLRVHLMRSPALATVAATGSGLEPMIDRFCAELEGFIATSVVRRKDGSSVVSRSADPAVDARLAASGYARVVESHLAAVASLGAAWGETEDILITTARAYLLIRLLGGDHCHWLAVSSEANLALCRLSMRSWEPFLLSELADLGEIPDRGD